MNTSFDLRLIDFRVLREDMGWGGGSGCLVQISGTCVSVRTEVGMHVDISMQCTGSFAFICIARQHGKCAPACTCKYASTKTHLNI